MKPLAIDCVILAAGLSSRMGRWKMGLDINGLPLLKRTVLTARQACHRVIVVTGFNAPLVQQLLAPLDRVEYVHNTTFQNGQFTSAKAGIAVVKSDLFFITVADLPFLKVDIFSELHHNLRPDCDVIFPQFKNKQGHPVLIRSSAIPDILSLPDDNSMKQALNNRPHHYLNTSDSAVIQDLDTPEEFQRLCTSTNPEKN